MRLRYLSALVVVAAVIQPGGRCASAAPSDSGLPRIAVAGSTRLPADAVAVDGKPVAIAGVSGATWLGSDHWVAVMDTGAAVLDFALDLEANGAPRGVREVRAVRLAARHDYEDVAALPPRIDGPFAAGRGRLILCEEDTPALRIVDATGAVTDGPPLPEAFAARRPNRGPESLCVAADGEALWTANEEALPDDGPAPTRHAGTVVRLVEVPLGAGRRRGRQVAYAVDPPHACVPAAAADVYSGVVAIAALPDGRLLVLERSAARCLPPFENRIYVVDPGAAANVAAVAGDLAARPGAVVAKRLAWRGALGCNLEGLAVGPPLAGGGTALVAVADAGGLDAPNQVVVLRMDGPVTSP